MSETEPKQSEIQYQVGRIAQELNLGLESDWAKEWQANNDDGEQPTAYDWLNDALDIEYVVNGKREYLGARVLVTFGGPNIWVDFRDNRVDGYWWDDEAHQAFRDTLGIGEALEELWGLSE